MGGRGRKSSLANQISLQDIIDKKEINEIIERAEKMRKGDIIGGDFIGQQKLKKCACCENYTIPVNTVNYRCPICSWIDNHHQNNNPDSLDGPNNITLREARLRWQIRGI